MHELQKLSNWQEQDFLSNKMFQCFSFFLVLGLFLFFFLKSILFIFSSACKEYLFQVIYLKVSKVFQIKKLISS